MRTLTRLSELLVSPAEDFDRTESVQEWRLASKVTSAALILLEVSALFETVRRADISQAGALRPAHDCRRGEEDDALARVIEVVFSEKSEDCKDIAGDDALHDALRTCIFSSIAGDPSLTNSLPQRRLLKRVCDSCRRRHRMEGLLQDGDGPCR